MALQLLENPGLLEIVQVAFKIPDEERAQYLAMTGRDYDPERVAAELSLSHGPRWVLMDGTTVVSVAGFSPVRAGVWETWMLTPTESFEKYGREITRHTRRAIKFMLENGAHRLQCVSLADRIEAHRWYLTLGLRQESLLNAFGAHGEDAVMFVKTRKPDSVQQ